jgi:nitrilase
VNETSIGKIGMLICGENTNPLARYTLMAQGEQVHVSSWPACWPTKDPKSGANYDLADAIRIRSAAHSFEAKCFNIVCAAYLDDATLDALTRECGAEARRILEDSPKAVSMVINPAGKVIAERRDEGLLYAKIDLIECIEPKQFQDVVGYYQRYDVFQLHVNRTANRPIYFTHDQLMSRSDTGGSAAKAQTPALHPSASTQRTDGETDGYPQSKSTLSGRESSAQHENHASLIL